MNPQPRLSNTSDCYVDQCDLLPWQDEDEHPFGMVYPADPFWVDSGVLPISEGDEAAEVKPVSKLDSLHQGPQRISACIILLLPAREGDDATEVRPCFGLHLLVWCHK